MSTILEIERAIDALNPEEFRELLVWMEQKGLDFDAPAQPSQPVWPDFAARQREVFGSDFSLPAGYTDGLIHEDRGE